MIDTSQTQEEMEKIKRQIELIHVCDYISYNGCKDYKFVIDARLTIQQLRELMPLFEKLHMLTNLVNEVRSQEF